MFISFSCACINRNIVECKAKTLGRIWICLEVLIETLWNVKEDWNFRVMIPAMVLIETLWNVKSYAYQNFCEMYEGINRNIVECKGSPRQTERPGSHSINRNIVECKEGFPLRFADSSLSINRNIVECKVCKKKCLNMLFLLVLIETLWNVKI